MHPLPLKPKLNVPCPICGEPKAAEELFLGSLIHESVAVYIQKNHPSWKPTQFICFTCLNTIRTDYVADILTREQGNLTAIEKQVIKSMRSHDVVTHNVNKQFEQQLTIGQRLADGIATFGGSWRFIILFGFILFAWIAINTVLLFKHPFDPYPFIL